MLRANVYTFPASDAFRAVGVFAGFNIHPACFGTKTAVYTFVLINMHSHEAYFLKQTVKGTQWAYVFTEWPVDENRRQNANDE